ncbi:MAG: S8 family serine peptidase, partial [Promethearchaeota archaeon]
VLDSGVDSSHSLINESQLLYWNDLVDNTGSPNDPYGHGTALAAIISGSSNDTAEPLHDGAQYYMTLGGNYSHADLFYPDGFLPAWYRIKLGSFLLDESASDILVFNASVNDTSLFKNHQLELYRNGSLVEESQNIGENVSFLYNTTNLSEDKSGNYDVVFAYEIDYAITPEFTLAVNLTFTPPYRTNPAANYSGIAPDVNLVALKVLNSYGFGLVSNVISALTWVEENNALYHIFATVLSLSAVSLPEPLQMAISLLIDRIINKGTMVVIAAGNLGVGNQYNSLAYSQKALVVGAMNDQDQLTFYTSQGSDLESEEGILRYASDILAPGGSLLLDHQMVITAESNNTDSPSDSDLHANDLTSMYGTSIAAAIVTGIYDLVAQHFGGWASWNSTNGTSALQLKQLMCLTASETNLLREDDPYSSLDESLSSPPLNRGTPDIHEGYGRINPLGLFNMLNTTYIENRTTGIALAASASNASGSHIYGTRILLEKEVLYNFQMSLDETTQPFFDADMYLYDSLPNEYGEPILVGSSTAGIFNDEAFYFSNFNETHEFYLVLKAISGEGVVSFEVIKENLTVSPVLQNASVSVLNPDENYDILDTFRFEVNYSQSQNFPPGTVYLHLNNSIDPILMTKEPFDNNYTDGVLYHADYYFDLPGDYEYEFSAQTGNFTVIYQDPFNHTVSVSTIGKLATFGYSTDFMDQEDTNALWDFAPSSISLSFQAGTSEFYAGWDWIDVPYTLEDRRITPTDENWTAMYCGIMGEIDSGHQHELYEVDNQPLYSYMNLSGNFNLISPYIMLPDAFSNPISQIGLRLGLKPEDTLEIQISLNRSESWTTLETYTGTQTNWILSELDLSSYIDSYIRIRVHVSLSGSDEINYSGAMIDYFTITDGTEANTAAPKLEAAHYLSKADSIQPYYSSDSNTILDIFTFSVAYSDTDGNLPRYVYLDIGGENTSRSYLMENSFGRWDPQPANLTDFTKEIIFQYSIPLLDLANSNTSYRFRTFDGKFFTATSWFDSIDFSSSTPQQPGMDALDYSQFLMLETPPASISSIWLSTMLNWHQVTEFGRLVTPSEIYCGSGNYQGYTTNFDADLLTPVISLNSEQNLFLNFTHRLRFDTEGDAGDFGVVSLSTNLGESWKTLETFRNATLGLGTVPISLDLSGYMGQEVIFKFSFHSDDVGIQIRNSGWKISTISVDLNRSLDYENPFIEYTNLVDGTHVSGQINVSIRVSDNVEIDIDRTQFWVDNHETQIQIIDGYIFYLFDATEFDHGDRVEFVVIAYDLEGNRAIESISIIIDNPLHPTFIVLISLGAMLVVGGMVFWAFRERRIRSLLATGDYIRKPNVYDRHMKQKFDQEKVRVESLNILSQIDPKSEWELQQPLRLHCTSCLKNYSSNEFELYCPNCHQDKLNIAKYCPVCEKWKYFADEGITVCDKCDLPLLKDFAKAKTEILQNPTKYAQKIEEHKRVKTSLQEVIKDLPKENLESILREIIEEDINNTE